MKKKLVLVLAAALLLVGCGNAKNDTSKSGTEGSENAITSEDQLVASDSTNGSTEQSKDVQSVSDEAVAAAGEYLLYSVTNDYEGGDGITYTCTANTQAPQAGTIMTFSGVCDEYSTNAVAPLNADGSIDYDRQVEVDYSFVIPEGFADNGVFFWLNAWECGFDAAVRWTPDGEAKTDY